MMNELIVGCPRNRRLYIHPMNDDDWGSYSRSNVPDLEIGKHSNTSHGRGGGGTNSRRDKKTQFQSRVSCRDVGSNGGLKNRC